MEVELHNRLRIGFALGWSYYKKDEAHNYSEITIYIGLISLKITWI